MRLSIDSEEYLYKETRNFSIEACLDRAIPSVVDGLKSAQRKAIFILEGKKGYTKTISSAGEMISANIYLHGDASAAGVLSAMSCVYSNNYCYLQGKGTFGTKIYPTEYASPRYTYVKLSSFAERILLKDKDIIPMKDNYDESVKEPKYYLPLIPTVLLNGISGLGVGWNTNILPHKILDVIDYSIDILTDKNVVDNLTPSYKSYEEIDIKPLEDSRYLFTSKVIQDTDFTFKIQELAPGISLEKVVEVLDTLEDKGIIKSYEDNSKSNIDITINFKRGTKYTIDDVIRLCKLSTTDVERLVVVDFDDDSIKQYKNHRELVQNFLNFRQKWFYDRYNKKIEDVTNKINYNRVFSYLYQQGISNSFREKRNKSDLIDFCLHMSRNLDIEDSKRREIIQSIVDLPIYKWTKEEELSRLDLIKKFEQELLVYKNIIATPDNVKNQYIKELRELREMFKKD